jgi:hypothetical protein
MPASRPSNGASPDRVSTHAARVLTAGICWKKGDDRGRILAVVYLKPGGTLSLLSHRAWVGEDICVGFLSGVPYPEVGDGTPRDLGHGLVM